jgi:hypothetical protein
VTDLEGRNLDAGRFAGEQDVVAGEAIRAEKFKKFGGGSPGKFNRVNPRVSYHCRIAPDDWARRRQIGLSLRLAGPNRQKAQQTCRAKALQGIQ